MRLPDRAPPRHEPWVALHYQSAGAAMAMVSHLKFEPDERQREHYSYMARKHAEAARRYRDLAIADCRGILARQKGLGETICYPFQN